MARPLRIQYAGALYHVTSRGNARHPIFRDDLDRKTFLDILKTVTEDSRWLCHGYCLMTNHYHLIIETPEANLSSGMRQLNGICTMRFNWRHRTVGHVFQGRFKAILIKREPSAGSVPIRGVESSEKPRGEEARGMEVGQLSGDCRIG